MACSLVPNRRAVYNLSVFLSSFSLSLVNGIVFSILRKIRPLDLDCLSDALNRGGDTQETGLGS